MNTTQTDRTGPSMWLRALVTAFLVAVLATVGALASAGSAFADTGSSYDHCPQLDEGDTGPCVAKLQRQLTKVHPEYGLPGSETFGPATRIALLDFQGRNHLGADGRFGSETAALLQKQYEAAGGGAVASPKPGKPAVSAPTPKSQAGSGAPAPCPKGTVADPGGSTECVSPKALAEDSQLSNKTALKVAAKCTYQAIGGKAVAGAKDAGKVVGKVLWKGKFKKLPKKGDVVDAATGFMTAGNPYAAGAYIIGCTVLK